MKVTFALAAIALPLASAGPLVARTNPNGCVPLGCYSDSVSARALRVNTQIIGGPSAQSPQACTSACIARGLAYGGVEYGSECWCGSSIANSHGPISPGSCNMPCSGAPGEKCGGPGAINVYDCSAVLPVPQSYNGCKPKGCYTDSVSYRTLGTNVQVVGGHGNQNPDGCTAACKAAGFRYAGNEYSGECWCGNTLANGGGPAPDGNEQCQMKCNGNQSLMCGGPDRLTLYDCAPPSTCDTPGVCGTFQLISDPSCGPLGQCTCGFDADGRNVCFENVYCGTGCSADADCGSGEVCWAQNCCGSANVCTKPATICANPTRLLFRAPAEKAKKAEGCTAASC